MQPTNQLHLGNYLGALKNWVRLQDEANELCLYGIVDLHAITVSYDSTALADATREIAAAYIASGIDLKKSTLFVQSAVTEHTHLNWLFATMTQMGKLNRMTQFKDKAGKNAEKASLGLYSYPVLMAADILIYNATHVPVGEDQKQHLELAREIASTFNHRYNTDFFVQPETISPGLAARVMSFRDGTQKMSKSAESDMSRINLTDTPELIEKKIKKAKTDPQPLPETIDGLEGRAEAANLISIYAALSDKSQDDVLAEFAGKAFSEFKPVLTELAVAKLAPLTQEMRRLLADKGEIDRILSEGSAKASEVAAANIVKIEDIMGFWKPGH
tara:strand:+ start:590 stop:1579 length:990 start_codon:yes stop_codon:yes gene_type:complete